MQVSGVFKSALCSAPGAAFDNHLLLSLMPPPEPPNALPPFGFSEGQTFESLSQHHFFLFRVHDITTSTRFEPHLGFAASAYRGYSHGVLRNNILQHDSLSNMEILRNHDLCLHAMQQMRTSSAGERTEWISTSYSPLWVLFEAFRRAKTNPDAARTISVIDATNGGVRAFLAKELLAHDTQKGHQQRSHWANAAQEVLVLDMVPTSAIFSTIYLSEIVPYIPSWLKPLFTRKGGYRGRVTQCRILFQSVAVHAEHARVQYVCLAIAMLFGGRLSKDALPTLARQSDQCTSTVKVVAHLATDLRLSISPELDCALEYPQIVNTFFSIYTCEFECGYPRYGQPKLEETANSSFFSQCTSRVCEHPPALLVLRLPLERANNHAWLNFIPSTLR